VAFGMPAAMLGAGWPEARHLVDRPSSALGLVAAVYGFGRLATSATAQPLLRRWTIRRSTTILLVALCAASLVVAVGRSFPLLVVTFGVVGAVSGALDSLGTRYQTVVRLVRNAGLMFGAYGVGATLGPALIAVTSWTAGFLVAAALALAAAVLAWSPGVTWPAGIESPATAAAASAAAAPAAAGRRVAPQRHPVPAGPLALSLLCFAVYVALEVATGSWMTSYLEGDRGSSPRAAGLAVSGFWAGVTVGRLVMGRIRAHPRRLLAGGAVTIAAAYATMPFLPTAGAMVAVVVAGAALAVMVPTLVVTTAERVGVAATGRVTGWQILAANTGATVVSGGIGLLVARTGDGAPVWVLMGLAIVGLPVLLRALAVHPPEE
ncbi:MAG: hypothetical protein JWM47_2409, partial [Acidimicrobiales bacterium]|nr:hypothetical protein [Acidimicrobiales bacterium]